MIEKLKEILQISLEKMNIEKNLDEILIEVPKDNNNGDYASNIAMQLTKILKENPRNIANKIIENIESDDIEKVEIAGPGFINFYVKKDYLFENMNKILLENENYGKNSVGKNKKINIEYVSANPTGTLHLGHGRGAVYGDSLARILTFSGFLVDREYYINDAGNQINNLNKSIKVRYNNLCGINEELPENGYHGVEIIKIAEKIYNQYGNNATEEVFNTEGLEFLLNEIKKDLENFRVTFDIWSSEKSLYKENLVDECLNKLIKDNHTYESEGAIWLKTTEYGDDKDRVLIKADQNKTYLLPDIAYHIKKYERGYDELIDILGADHHGYVPRLKAGIGFMGENPDKLTVKILQMVRLLKNGEEIKLSKRTGKVVTLKELLEEVGVDATRYFFASRSLDTQLDFDLGLATSKSNENPVYYIQYAHARICSILNDFKGNIEPIENYETISSEHAYNLLARLYEFPQVVKNSAIKKAPHMITNYVYDVANLFHSFYAHEKILTDDIKMTKERINLIKATSIVIKNALNLIAIEAKERM